MAEPTIEERPILILPFLGVVKDGRNEVEWRKSVRYQICTNHSESAQMDRTRTWPPTDVLVFSRRVRRDVKNLFSTVIYLGAE